MALKTEEKNPLEPLGVINVPPGVLTSSACGERVEIPTLSLLAVVADLARRCRTLSFGVGVELIRRPERGGPAVSRGSMEGSALALDLVGDPERRTGVGGVMKVEGAVEAFECEVETWRKDGLLL